MAQHRLTSADIKGARPGDKLPDGGGLRLDVDRNGSASWVLRFTSPATRKERYLGLGPLRDVPLATARRMAGDARRRIAEGCDPIEAKREERAQAKVAASRAITLRAYAEGWIAGHEAGWKNPKHRQQWRNSLAAYVFPPIGSKPISDINTADILTVLRPIWQTKPETAARVRGRIEMILAAARAEGLRGGENPATWRGHLDQLFPSRKQVRAVKHHAALPYVEMPRLWKSLAADKSDAARLLQFIILTAARYGEAANAGAVEIDCTEKVWTVPASRMKAGRPHAVPLSAAAMALLESKERLLFASPMTGKAISDAALAKCIRRHSALPATVHGFRSTFRDWAGDCTTFPREIAEAALAHVVEDEVEAAYRRSTALERRRELMEAWASFCGSCDCDETP